MRTRQIGISPKVIATVVTAIVGWLVTRYGLDLDPEACARTALRCVTGCGPR